MSAADAPVCLIVDDEPYLRQVLIHLMRTDGFTCIEASNGVEALEQLARQPVILVLSDLRMPVMTGMEMLRQIELGGHVHDIGKIGVREGVLNKPGKLTEEEYQHIMTHPVLGWRILAPLFGEVPHALNIVRSHHERFDGRGVPDGLQGRTIPLEARVAAAADAFDAMTSDRPYRASEMTLESAVEEIRRGAGTQFDPEVVSALVGCAERGELTLLPRTSVTPAASTAAI